MSGCCPQCVCAEVVGAVVSTTSCKQALTASPASPTDATDAKGGQSNSLGFSLLDPCLTSTTTPALPPIGVFEPPQATCGIGSLRKFQDLRNQSDGGADDSAIDLQPAKQMCIGGLMDCSLPSFPPPARSHTKCRAVTGKQVPRPGKTEDGTGSTIQQNWTRPT